MTQALMIPEAIASARIRALRSEVRRLNKAIRRKNKTIRYHIKKREDARKLLRLR
jgi:hypothetical protein